MGKIKQKLCIVLAGICTLSVTACGKQDIPEPDLGAGMSFSDEAAEILKTTDYPVAESRTELLADGINQFGLTFFSKLNMEENQFFSPYSICSALSMLDVGAGGETKEELENMLGITDLNEWNQQMKLYLEKEWGEDTKVLTGNSLWISPDMDSAEHMADDFLAPVTFYYQGDVYKADFQHDGKNVVKQINQWVERHTDGMISKYKERVDPLTVLSILNAVYFEGKWESPFKGEDTVPDAMFINALGEAEKDIPMMCQEQISLRYVETDTLKGVELPYRDSTVVMDVLLPRQDASTQGAELYHQLSVEEQAALWQSFDAAQEQEITELRLPAFTMDVTVDNMPEILKEMGMNSAFEESADLDKIGQDLFVSDVAHRAKIEVSEEGTRAAAVTEIYVSESCMEETQETIRFIANRPFVYAIRDTETGMILFLGQVITMQE